MGRGSGTIELTGAPRKLSFPQACASCGTPAGRRIPVEKVFERQRGAHAVRYRVVRAEVPFCTTCLQKHRDEAKHLPAGQRMLSALRSALLIPVAGFVVAAVALLVPFTHRLGDRDWGPALIYFALAVSSVLFAIGCAVAALRRSHRHRVAEPTSITSAFDFTDDLSELFERERHSYNLRNARFAEAFVAVNASRVWDSRPRRRNTPARGRGRSAVLFAGFVGSLVFVAWIVAEAAR